MKNVTVTSQVIMMVDGEAKVIHPGTIRLTKQTIDDIAKLIAPIVLGDEKE